MAEQNKVNVLIVDDEPVARQIIQQFLSEENGFNVIGEAGDGVDALNKIETLKPELVFLDIQMPEITGIELIGNLTDPIPLIVFVTAYDRYAVQAFEENALDYILKPFDQNRFSKSIERVRQRLTTTSDEPSGQLNDVLNAMEKLLAREGKPKYLKKIGCKQKGVIKLVQVSDIVWVESEGAFCKLHTTNGIQLTNMSIKHLEEVLDPNTHPRIHKSHIINVDQIESMEPYFHGEYMINLKGGQTLKLSRGYKDKLDRILNQYK